MDVGLDEAQQQMRQRQLPVPEFPSTTERQRMEAMQTLAHIFASMFESLPLETAIATESKAA